MLRANPTEEAAQLRFVNAVPQSDTLSLLIGGRRFIAHGASGDGDEYQAVVPGDARLALIRHAVQTTSVAKPGAPAASGRGDTVAVSGDHLQPYRRYSVVSMPGIDGRGVTLRLIGDDWLRDSSRAQIRLINTVADAGAFDLLLVGTEAVVFHGVGHAAATPFQGLAPSASQRLAVRSVLHPDDVRPVERIERLDPGRAYTILVIGHRDDWETLVLNDDVADAYPARRNVAREGRARLASSMRRRP